MAKKNRTIKRRILKAKVSHLSLCPRGKNQIQTMFKSEDGKNHDITIETLVKEMTEQGELVAAVYVPDMIDSDGDTASAKVIKEMAYDFAAHGEGVDIRHNEETLSNEDAFVAESFIIQKDDPRFADMKDYDDEEIDVTGGWGVVVKIENEQLRKEYREGRWGGISMGGLMAAKPETGIESVAKEFISMLKSFGNKNTQKHTKKPETDMDLTKENKTEIATIVTETFKTLETEKIKKAEEDAAKKKDKKGLGYPTPILKASPSEKDLENHRRKLAIFELSKEVDSTDSSAVFEFTEKAKEIAQAKDLNEVINKQEASVYETYFKTNQKSNEVKHVVGSIDDPTGDEIMAQLAKEEEAADKSAA